MKGDEKLLIKTTVEITFIFPEDHAAYQKWLKTHDQTEWRCEIIGNMLAYTKEVMIKA